MIILLIPITFLLLVIFLVVIPEPSRIKNTDFSKSIDEADKDYNSRMGSTIEFQRILDKHFLDSPTEDFKVVIYEGIMTWKDDKYDSPNKDFWESISKTKQEEIYGGFAIPAQPRPDSSIESC